MQVATARCRYTHPLPQPPQTRAQGWSGSGTVFFGLCNLRCVFCQNWDISQQRQGEVLDGKVGTVPSGWVTVLWVGGVG